MADQSLDKLGDFIDSHLEHYFILIGFFYTSYSQFNKWKVVVGVG